MRLRLLAAAVLTGVAAGLGGAALTELLHAVQHLAFGYTENTFLVGVERAAPLRRVLAVGIGGAVVALGWWAQRRSRRVDEVAARVSVPRALTADAPHLAVGATVVDAVLQIAAVGVGGSLGREGAPRQVGAALGGWLAARLGLPAAQQRTLLACGAGAGLAAVYNVPLGGAIFTLELLLASRALRDVVPALVTSGVATVVAWPALSDAPTYQVGRLPAGGAITVGALLLGPVAGLAGVAFARLTRAAHHRAPAGGRGALAVTVVFTALGAMAIPYPQLLGNGRGLTELAFTGALPLGLAAVLVLLKPLATAACLASGAAGGLLTPSLATGAALGAAAGGAWTLLWPGAPLGAYAVVGAAALLAVTQRAPVTAVVLVLEFLQGGGSLLGPIVLAVLGATATASMLDRRQVPAVVRPLLRGSRFPHRRRLAPAAAPPGPGGSRGARGAPTRTRPRDGGG
jgi:H+/Cl- antiporter ClcA